MFSILTSSFMINSIKSIKSFNEIVIKNNYLIVCDIDDTLLTFTNMTRQHWDANKKQHYNIHGSNILADQYSFELWIEHIHSNKPLATDYHGFNNMISKTDNKIIFVTARNAKFKNITK